MSLTLRAFGLRVCYFLGYFQTFINLTLFNLIEKSKIYKSVGTSGEC